MRTPTRDLKHGALHVWRIRIDQPERVVFRLEAHLSADEARRAGAFRREEDRQRYVVAHGALREILAGYTAQAPRDLRFRVTAAGKPTLIDDCGEEPLQFGLSHSGEWALAGVALSARIGVDIERIDAETSMEAIVARFFSRGEWEAFRAVPEERRTDVFFDVWARKEAYVKARGEGIVNRLHLFSLSVDPADRPVLLHDTIDEGAPLRWRIYDLDAAPGYAAAVAAEGPEHRLQISDWTPSIAR